MKIFNIKNLALLAAFGLLAACSENSWNDHYLDGFQVPPVYESVQTVEYTLTADDYSAIASNSTNKSLAASAGETDELEAIGINKYFETKAQAQKYLPAFLSSPSFEYFVLDNGSSLLVNYSLPNAGNATIANINSRTTEYIVSEEEYMNAWGNEDNYIDAFAPMLPASSYLPNILRNAFPDAEEGDYVVVNYNEATSNPIFGSVSGGDEPDEFEMTDVLGSVSVGDALNVKGIVTAINAVGFVVTDLGGSIFYYDRNFDDNVIAIGNQVEVTGSVGVYNRGMQVSVDQSYRIVGTSAYEYPEPVFYTGEMVEEVCKAENDLQATYLQINGTVSISGNYTNIILEGTECQASPYSPTDNLKDLFIDGENVVVTGYLIYVASSKYFYMMVTDVVPASRAYLSANRAPVVPVETVVKNAIYVYEDGRWVAPSNTIVLQPSDYADMNQSYGNLSGDLPSTLLPVYLEKNYPYAVEDDVMIVVYKYYASGAGTTYQGMQFVNDGIAWNGWVEENMSSDRFGRNDGEWVFNPSVTLTLPYVRNDPTSVTFYQACVDWVYNNIDVPYYGSESLTSGKGFVTTYGNNEYYSGASAYYCNVDVRANSARNQCGTGFGDFPGYDSMTDEEVIQSMKDHFDYEVVPGVLANLYPNAVPVENMEVLYTVTFTAYYIDGAEEVTAVWEVVGPAQFEFVSSTWR